MINTQFAVQVRLVQEAAPGYDTATAVHGAKDVVDRVRDLYEGLDREMVVCLALSASHTVNARHIVSIGTLDSCPVHPRELFKVAILSNSAAVILVHNHPSGSVVPSGPDLALTRRIQRAGEIMGIELLDHVIVDSTVTKWTSLREFGAIVDPR